MTADFFKWVFNNSLFSFMQIVKDGSQWGQDVLFQSFHILLNKIFDLKPMLGVVSSVFDYNMEVENEIFKTLSIFLPELWVYIWNKVFESQPSIKLKNQLLPSYSTRILNQSILGFYFLECKFFYFLHLLILPYGRFFIPMVCNFYIMSSSSVRDLSL